MDSPADSKTLGSGNAFIVGFAVWTLLALLTASRNHLTYQQLGYEVPSKITLISSFVDYYLWAAASVLIFRLTERFPLESPRIFRNFFVHLFLGIILTFSVALISIPVFVFLTSAETAGIETFTDVFHNIVFKPANLYQGFITFWATAAVAHAVIFYRRSREKEARLQKLAVRLAEAKLNALQMQLQPHFLFNTLNSISALLHRNADKAEQMIAYLGDFLRLTLSESSGNLTTLKKEIHFLETYLKIEEIRFQDRLKVVFDITPDALNAQVPTLIAQPLVENTIRHGFADQSSECVLEISALRDADYLRLTIADNGAGLPDYESKNQAGGVGLTNTILRLKETYGDNFKFEIKNREPLGTVVKVEIPFVFTRFEACGKNLQ